MLRELDDIKEPDNSTEKALIEPIESLKKPEVDIKEWPQLKRSLFSSCTVGCIYCPNGKATERNPDMGVWSEPTPTESVITFPYGHEISEYIYPACIEIMHRYLTAGNHLKVYTHGSPSVMEDIVEDLEPWIDQVEIMIRISSNDNDLLKFWEPNGPSYDERVTALMMPYVLDFKTSLLINPMMGFHEDIIKLMKDLYEFITGNIYLELIDPTVATLMMVDPMDMFDPVDVRYIDSVICTDPILSENDGRIVWGKYATQMLQGDWTREERN